MHGLYPGVQRRRVFADASVDLADSAVPVVLPPMMATAAETRATLLASSLALMLHHPSLGADRMIAYKISPPMGETLSYPEVTLQARASVEASA